MKIFWCHKRWYYWWLVWRQDGHWSHCWRSLDSIEEISLESLLWKITNKTIDQTMYFRFSVQKIGLLRLAHLLTIDTWRRNFEIFNTSVLNPYIKKFIPRYACKINIFFKFMQKTIYRLITQQFALLFIERNLWMIIFVGILPWKKKNAITAINARFL